MSLNFSRRIVIEEVFDFAVFDASPSQRERNDVVEPSDLVHVLFVIALVLVVDVFPQYPLRFELEARINGLLKDYFVVVFYCWLI